MMNHNRLVLWGRNGQDDKILVALELLVDANQVKILSFPDRVVLDDFYEKMRTEWRDGKEVELVEGYETLVRDLTADDTLLPEDIKVERADLLVEKQLEWQVVVLSAKMNAQFCSELESIKDRVERLDVYDKGTWETLKGFWDRVQTQVRDGLLSRKYERELRKTTDVLFSQMKDLRKKVDEEFRSKAKANFDRFSAQLEDVEKRIGEGTKLSKVFDDLKELQRQFHNTKFTKDLREKVWQRMDGAFKAVKEKKYGKSGGGGNHAGGSYDNSALGRLARRYDGLLKAIDRQEYLRSRDQKDLDFERRRIERTDGQLEAQIRQAKIKMIEKKMEFKDEKLKEMYATKTQLEGKMEKMKEKEHLDKIRKEKEAAAKAKIQAEVKQAEDMDEATKQKLAAAAEKINEGSKSTKTHRNADSDATDNAQPKEENQSESILDKVKTALSGVSGIVSEVVEEAVDNVKAVTTVVVDEVSEHAEPLAEKGKEVVENIVEKAHGVVEDISGGKKDESGQKDAEDK